MRPSIVPYFGYRDAAAAVDFLSRAFGFTVVQRFDGEDGTVAHAELAHGSGVVMLGSTTAEAQGVTQVPEGTGVYLVVADVDAHHAGARAAGAEIVHGPEDTEFGTRRYRARDPEGYEWSFGTYAPEAKAPA